MNVKHSIIVCTYLDIIVKHALAVDDKISYLEL